MAQNFLYMLEFVVDDLLITRPNMCAPEEYPTCCELTFRSHVFVSICDKEFGGCIDTARRSGKCCLFSLETPINRSDRLQLNVFKKRTDQCKFLIGATEIPVHRMFDKVTDDFYTRNPTWDAHLKNPKANIRSSITKKNKVVIDNDCGADSSAANRKEELSPTYELSKKLLALSNMQGTLQTGNIVLIMRLACMGPTIVSPFLVGQASASPRPKMKAPCEKNQVHDSMLCKRYFSKNADKGCPCAECEDEEDRCPNKRNNNEVDKFNNCSSNDQASKSRGCPCPDCDEECEIDENENDVDEEDQDEENSSDIVMKPCVMCPSKPDYGPEKYDAFEANLNGSGLTIRVLKDSHVVENVCDIESDEDIGKFTTKKGKPTNSLLCHDNLNDLVQNYTFARNHIERRTGGNIVNHKSLPIVRGNIKYSENDSCCGGDSINIPLLNKLPPIKSVDAYRKTPSQIRNCCLQVQAGDIDNTLRGINAATKKKGIEVCHKTFDDPDTDVFLVRLGNKKSAENKKNTIEIELRTPKEPSNVRAQKWTKETQVDEAILDANSKTRKRRGRKGSRKSKCF